MLLHGSPRYYFDCTEVPCCAAAGLLTPLTPFYRAIVPLGELFYSALDSSGVSAAAFSSPVLNVPSPCVIHVLRQNLLIPLLLAQGNEIKALLPPELQGKLIGS
jgi:hypothetical protein